MKPSKSDKESLQRFASSGLVQFRADPILFQGLNQLADRLHMPVGALARLWVAERLLSETTFDVATLENWRLSRYAEIEKVVESEFNAGPVLVLHIVPFNKFIDIDPAVMGRFVGMLPPTEQAEEVTGRINLEGYRTIKRCQSDMKLSGYVQVFREGQIESVREITTDENKGIIGEAFDSELIAATWSYSCALEALGVQPPLAIFVRLMNAHGVCMRSAKNQKYSPEMNYGAFNVQGVTINSWSEVLKIDAAAKKIKRVLDRIANSAGLPRSFSFTEEGVWKKASDYSVKKEPKLKNQVEMIELSGFGDLTECIEIKAKEANTEIVIGKVRPPSLEITSQTIFKCFVKQSDLSPGAESFLREKFLSKQILDFAVGEYKFRGLISRQPYAGYGGGAFDGINISPNPTLLYEIRQI